MISVATLMTVKESDRAIKNHLMNRARAIFIGRIVGIIYLIFLLITTIIESSSFSEIIPNIGYLQLLISINLIIFPSFFIWSTRANTRKSPIFNKAIKWIFEDEKISGSGDGFNFSQNWNNIYSVIFTKDGFLIYPEINVYYWISKSFFNNEEDIVELKSLIKNNIDNSKIKEKD